MKTQKSLGARGLARTVLALACTLGALIPFATTASARAATGPNPLKTLSEAVAAGRLDPALVRELRTRGQAEGIVTFEHGPGDAAPVELADQKSRALGGLSRATVVREFEFLPASDVRFRSEEDLLGVANAPGVTGVAANHELALGLDASLPLIRQPLAFESGYTGAGTEVAVIDTGLIIGNFGCGAAGPGCVISESLDLGANDNENMSHGTNVAGIVQGVAPGARIVEMDVFGQNANGNDRTSDAEIIQALNEVVARRRQGRNIRAVNMSLGRLTTYFTSACSTSPGSSTTNPYISVFATLRGSGVLPVVAAMNDAFGMRNTSGAPAFTNGISFPACTSGALSVGAVFDAALGVQTWRDPARTAADCTDNALVDRVTCFSQTGPNLTMLAPGSLITAAGIPNFAGTSMATPHVAGAAAVLAAAKPSAAAPVIEQALAGSGPRIANPRNGVIKRRLDVCEALQALLGRATARVTPPTLRYTAGACEANNVTVSLASGVYTITDTGAAINPDTGVAITPGTGCSAVAGNPRQVTCSASSVTELSITTGDRNDTVTVAAATRASISGGPGDDTLNGGPLTDTVSGDDGRDRLDGAEGDDVLRGGLGPDVMKGGMGTDQADYFADVPGGRSGGVNVTIDDAANDGRNHEVDNVLMDVEWILGTLHGDSLTGSAANNIIWGSAGADTLRGGGGNDTLYGEAGADSLFGDAGADTLDGGNENDQLAGGLQGDVLRGSFGRDTLAGEDGADFLDGGPGSALDGLSDTGDTISGGTGVDRATFSTHFTGVDVSLDGAANDGASGEVDNVMTDVENVSGSPFADALRGNGGANELRGWNGNDDISGGLGADWLYGEIGDDTLRARGFAGDTDGRVDCGAGSDEAQVDAADPVFECERLFAHG